MRTTETAIAGNQDSLNERLVDPTDDELEDPTNDEFIDSIVDELKDSTTGVVGTTPDKLCPRRASRKARGHSGSNEVMIPSMRGVAPLKPLESVEKGLCLARGEANPISYR